MQRAVVTPQLNRRRLLWPLLTLLSALLALLSVGLILAADAPLAGGRRVPVAAPGGETLAATYYPGSRPAGVLLLEGFGSDQVTMRSAASEFARAGLHVFTFDFAGHGRSPGALTFDNAATDRLALQVLAAKGAFKALSGLEDGQLILLGHSMGARVGLQAATLDTDPVAGLVLLGTQLNLATNVQSEFFTGISDADLDWVRGLGPDSPPVPVLLVSGRWDDILTPEGAELLLGTLSEEGESVERSLLLLDGLLHNYEIFSPRALSAAQAWASTWIEAPLPATAPVAGRRILLWITGWLGLYGAVLAGARWARLALPPLALGRPARIVRLRRFLWAKLWLWPASLPLMALVFALYWLVPLGTPVFNLTYVGFIGGYGLLMALLYRLGRVPGVEGRLALRQGAPLAPRRLLLAGGVGVGLLAFTAAYARTGWFYVPPTGARLLWLLLFVPPTALGFRIGLHEAGMLADAAPTARPARWLLTAVGLLPFFLWTAFQAALGSISGMVGGVQGLLILALVLAAGDLLERLLPRPWLVALFQALLLYWLVLPQGVLFR